MKEQKNFQRDEVEIFGRAWWLAEHICRDAMRVYRTEDAGAALKCLGDDDRIRKIDKAIYSEIVAYTATCVAERIRSEIFANHGKTDETWDLSILYACYIGDGLDKACDVGSNFEDGYFAPLINQYFNPDYDDEYDRFWDVQEIEVSLDSTLESLIQEITEASNDNTYNIDRLYVFRLSKISRIHNKEKVLSRAVEMYKNIGLSRYDEAYFGLSKDLIFDALADLSTSQELAEPSCRRSGCTAILLGLLIPIFVYLSM